MSISSVFDQDGQLRRPPRLDVFDLFGITCVRDDRSAGLRVWVITDRDERTLEVTDVVSTLVFRAGAHETNVIRDAIDRTIEGLMFSMLDHIVSAGWRVIAEPLGLKTTQGEEP